MKSLPLALLLLALIPAAASAGPRPAGATIVEIAPPVLCPTSEVRGADISPAGAVVGWSWCHPAVGFVWTGGAAVAVDCCPRAINSAGQVAASAGGAAWRDGTLLASPGSALGIDEAGTVVGESGGLPNAWAADGTAATLPGGGGMAWSIADGGGFVSGRSGNSAARWSPGLERLAPLWQATDLEAAYAVNDRGEAVGTSRTADGYNHAVLWRAGSTQPVRLIPKGKVYMSSAYGIDNRGRVVGSGNSPRARAFVWTPARGHVDLNTLVSGWSLHSANAINDAGQITGAGTNPAGLLRAYRLTLPEGF